MTERNRISNKYKNLKTKQLSLSELELMFTRFQLMNKEDPSKYNILEFIEQEDFRKDLFIKHNY
jgi:hypothetical protein